MGRIAEMHLHYENIHPYRNGNGLTGSLLINYILIALNQIPFVIPFETRKHYLTMMDHYDLDGLAVWFTELQKK